MSPQPPALGRLLSLKLHTFRPGKRRLRGLVAGHPAGVWPCDVNSRHVTPDTGIRFLRIHVLTNNMGRVTSRDPSVTGRSPKRVGGFLLREYRLAPLFAFSLNDPPTRKHSPPVSARETQDPCQRGADRSRNSPSPERNT